MPSEPLILPEPAHSLFALTADLLEQWLPTILPPGASWWLGGGTVLAAQWEHRTSTDLDIFLPGNTGIAALSPEWDGRFTNEMAELGATRLAIQAKGMKFSFPSGRVEITTLDPMPALDPVAVRVDDRDAWVLPNACILTGKLSGREMRMPPRDVFDICVAAEEAPKALRCAVNHLPTQSRAEIVARLLESEADYLEDAAESILDPAPQWSHLLTVGTREASSALVALAYREIDVTYENGQACVRLETESGAGSSLNFGSAQELVQGLLELGLEQWIVGNHGSIEAFLRVAKVKLSSSNNTRGGPP